MLESQSKSSAAAPTLKPGASVDIVTEIDWDEDRIELRRATTYAVDDRDALLSQTSPPVMAASIGRVFQVSFMARRDGELKRYGFEARLTGIVRDYRLHQGDVVAALRVHRESPIELVNIRMSYRLEPAAGTPIALYREDDHINLIDISLGGAKITHYRARPPELGGKFELELDIEGKRFAVEASLVRRWPARGRIAPHLETVSIRFEALPRSVRDRLARAINDAQRNLRARD